MYLRLKKSIILQIKQNLIFFDKLSPNKIILKISKLLFTRVFYPLIKIFLKKNLNFNNLAHWEDETIHSAFIYANSFTVTYNDTLGAHMRIYACVNVQRTRVDAICSPHKVIVCIRSMSQ